MRLQNFIYQNIMRLIKSKKMSLIMHIIVKRHVYFFIKFNFREFQPMTSIPDDNSFN